MTGHEAQVTPRRKIGPWSRACRLLLTAVVAFSAVQTAYNGISGFIVPNTLANPGFWFLIGVSIYYGLYQTAASGFGRRWGMWTLIAFAVVVIAAAVAAVASEGELRAAPLTWLLYGLVLWFLSLTAIAGLVSLVLGTAGCEFGALGELIRRLRGVPEPDRADPMWCIFGMRALDEWEARRSTRS
jgi:hypothetical protein